MEMGEYVNSWMVDHAPSVGRFLTCTGILCALAIGGATWWRYSRYSTGIKFAARFFLRLR
jgi:hypothetical protein